jgi:phosphoglycerate kinase
VRKLTIARLDLRNRRVFLRADLNVPIERGAVTDDTRITAVLPTIRHALDAGAAVVLASHLGRPKGKPTPEFSLHPVADHLAALLGRPVPLAPDCVGPKVEAQARALGSGELLLLENLRFHKEEEANDPGFAQALAALADVYVNDAFAAAHRAHASTAGITKYLQPAAAGLLMERELQALGRILESPERPVLAILGGAKVSDKVQLVEHLLERVQAIAVGGGMAFTFLKAQGHETGRSLVEQEHVGTAKRVIDLAAARHVDLVLPPDAVIAPGIDSPSGRTVPVTGIPADQMGLDIGPASIARFREVIGRARSIVWNGPMGVFERAPFAAGTLAVAEAVASAPGFSVVGGGDTVAAVNAARVADRIGYISTAGGAFLEFLEGRTLPGVEALTDA